MGTERWYVTVVDGSPLLERARSEPAFGEYLMMPGYFEPGRRRYDRGGPGAAFLAEVDASSRSGLLDLRFG